MNSTRRALAFLALNIIVSALTTLTILLLWDRAHRPQLAVVPSATPAAIAETSDSVAGEKTGDTLLKIETVIGPGDLQNEVVFLKRTGSGNLSMQGWTLQDERGNCYTFPALELFEGGAVQVYTSAGNDTPIELHWGRPTAAWRSGSRLTIRDPEGRVHHTYTIP